MANRIMPANNRTFNTSIGNWVGDIYWIDGPYHGHQGMMAIDLPGLDEEKQITLAYPYLNVPKNENQGLYWGYIADPIQYAWLEYSLELFDASGLLAPYATHTQPNGGWANFLYDFLTPGTWDKNTSGIIIKVKRTGGTPGAVYFDDLSMPYTITAKTDHLPLMGVH